MKDFIFIIGPSGVGKSTLAQGLFKHYNSVYAEMSMVPEFGILQGADPGKFEEEVCWEYCVTGLKKFHEMGFKNIISGDFDDLRTADIPIVFKGYDYITLKLICSDYTQNYNQMKNRGDGLIDFELLEKMTAKINHRPLLVNEVLIDVAGKSAEQVLKEAIDFIENMEPNIDYEYQKPNKEMFYSWIFGNGLR